MKKSNLFRLTSRHWLGYVVLMIAIYMFCSVSHRPILLWDPASGLSTWVSMMKGAPFNCLVAPDPSNIANNMMIFDTWWSPGQYLVPAFFTMFGLDLGAGALWAMIVFSVVGIVGYFHLYRALGFSRDIALMSCAFVVSCRFYSQNFIIYTGGQLLHLGSFPWIFLLCLKLKKLRYYFVPYLVLLFLAGAFLHLSFVICSLAILASLFIDRVLSEKNPKRLDSAQFFLKLGAIFLMFYGILYFTYLSKGNNAQGMRGFHFSWSGILYPLAGGFCNIFLSQSWYGDFIYRIFKRLDFAAVHYITYMNYIIGTLFTGLFSYLIVKGKDLSMLYKSVFFSFLTVYCFIFFYFYLTGIFVTGARAFLHDRYFIPVGLILLPGFLEIVRRGSSKIIKCGIYFFILASAVYGMHAFFALNRIIGALNNAGSLGFNHYHISRDAMKALRFLDTNIPQGNNLFYVDEPANAVEVKKNRVISMRIVPRLEEGYPCGAFRGRVDNLFVFSPENFDEPNDRDVKAILESFADYALSEWHQIRTGSSILYFQGKIPVSTIEAYTKEALSEFR